MNLIIWIRGNHANLRARGTTLSIEAQPGINDGMLREGRKREGSHSDYWRLLLDKNLWMCLRSVNNVTLMFRCSVPRLSLFDVCSG